jgi:hypothetical protein
MHFAGIALASLRCIKTRSPASVHDCSAASWNSRSRALILLLTALLSCLSFAYEKIEQKEPPPEPSLPAVDFQPLIERDTAKRGDDVTVFFLITNKSNTQLKALQVRLLNPGALKPKVLVNAKDPVLLFSPALTDVPPFGSQRAEAALVVDNGADFAQHRLIFALDYVWELNGKSFSSAQTGVLTLPVTRQFEEEAKGLPGGTAPLLYMLLPIIPAILAFEFWNSWRRDGTVKMPEFKTEYIVPSFLLAVVLGFVFLLAARRNANVDYSSTRSFVIIILASGGLGSAFPLLRWGYEALERHKKAFKAGDTLEEYLRKVLAAYTEDQLLWAKGKASGQQWEGLELKQPNGAKALGVRVQISAKPGSGLTWENLKMVIDDNGKINDRKTLLDWLRQGKLNLGYEDKIKQADANIEGVVATKGMENFVSDTSEKKSIVTPTN